MFKHNDPLGEAKESKPAAEVPTVEEKLHQGAVAPAPSAELLRDLMEKNLKWSQIIYEQNRKINRKLAWAAVAEWLRLLFIVVPLVVGTVMLAPYVKQLFQNYGQLLQVTSSTSTQPQSYESLIKMMPLTDEQKAQLQNMINK